MNLAQDTFQVAAAQSVQEPVPAVGRHDDQAGFGFRRKLHDGVLNICFFDYCGPCPSPSLLGEKSEGWKTLRTRTPLNFIRLLLCSHGPFPSTTVPRTP